jgi:hypothetical protein
MSGFKKNKAVPKISSAGLDIINQAEDVSNERTTNIKKNKYIKEITIPFTQDMSDLLEQMYNYHDGDISRRKLCVKYLTQSLKIANSKLV